MAETSCVDVCFVWSSTCAKGAGQLGASINKVSLILGQQMERDSIPAASDVDSEFDSARSSDEEPIPFSEHIKAIRSTSTSVPTETGAQLDCAQAPPISCSLF